MVGISFILGWNIDGEANCLCFEFKFYVIGRGMLSEDYLSFDAEKQLTK